MQVNKYLLISLLGITTSALSMEDYDPQEVIRITSFCYSLMTGKCIAQDTVIEFCNYQDFALRHRITFDNAQKLISTYEKTSKLFTNPLGQMLKEKGLDNLPQSKALTQLQEDLTLQEAKEIQLFYFYKLLEKSRIQFGQDSYSKEFLNAIYAIYFGAKEHFNTAMQIIEKKCALTLTQNSSKNLELTNTWNSTVFYLASN